MSGLDPERVVSVFSADRGARGSGYSLHPDLVLTAAHCVGDEHSLVDVRSLQQTASGSYCLSAALQYRVAVTGKGGDDGPDLALLVRADAPSLPPPTHGEQTRDRPTLGRLAGHATLPVTALAFPAMHEADGVINMEFVHGSIAPLSGARETNAPRMLEMQIDSGSPSPDRSRSSLWEGASGASVFSGDHVIGVIAKDRRQIAGRLQVAPLDGLFGEFGIDAANRHLIEAGCADDSTVVLHAVWRGGEILEPPYDPLPDPWSFADLLQPRFGTVRFIGRDAELRALTEWYGSPPPPEGPRLSATLLVGDSAVGKTRLARELCRTASARGWTAGLLSPIAAGLRESLAGLDEDLLIVVDDADARAGQIDALMAAADGVGERARQSPRGRTAVG